MYVQTNTTGIGLTGKKSCEVQWACLSSQERNSAQRHARENNPLDLFPAKKYMCPREIIQPMTREPNIFYLLQWYPHKNVNKSEHTVTFHCLQAADCLLNALSASFVIFLAGMVFKPLIKINCIMMHLEFSFFSFSVNLTHFFNPSSCLSSLVQSKNGFEYSTLLI
jgi:hypothetical protein